MMRFISITRLLIFFCMTVLLSACAVSPYSEAAEQGDADAQDKLGMAYQNGNGVTQDYEQAIYWYRKSADQGYADAQSNLGQMYENGIGVAQDYAQAVYWYHKAAEQEAASARNAAAGQGNADTQDSLAVIFLNSLSDALQSGAGQRGQDRHGSGHVTGPSRQPSNSRYITSPSRQPTGTSRQPSGSGGTTNPSSQSNSGHTTNHSSKK